MEVEVVPPQELDWVRVNQDLFTMGMIIKITTSVLADMTLNYQL